MHRLRHRREMFVPSTGGCRLRRFRHKDIDVKQNIGVSNLRVAHRSQASAVSRTGSRGRQVRNAGRQ